jgi:hypothetical protein
MDDYLKIFLEKNSKYPNAAHRMRNNSDLFGAYMMDKVPSNSSWKLVIDQKSIVSMAAFHNVSHDIGFTLDICNGKRPDIVELILNMATWMKIDQ